MWRLCLDLAFCGGKGTERGQDPTVSIFGGQETERGNDEKVKIDV